MGQEFAVFVERLERAAAPLRTHRWSAKFGGAVGGFNAHVAAYPAVAWRPFADAFVATDLTATLTGLGATELLICGMMTQNCVTHTALSRAAEPYAISVLTDACTTVSEVLHHIALHALSTRVTLTDTPTALPAAAPEPLKSAGSRS